MGAGSAVKFSLVSRPSMVLYRPDWIWMVSPSLMSAPSPSTTVTASAFSVSSGASKVTSGAVLLSAAGLTSMSLRDDEREPQDARARMDAVAHTAKTFRTNLLSDWTSW